MPSIDTSALTHGSKRIFKELNLRPSEVRCDEGILTFSVT
jgi:hypothetical protein